MQVLFINNDGGGFADYIEVAEATTLAALFSQRVPHGKPQDYLIRVNRQPVASNHVLVDGDRVSITPTKIEGAPSGPTSADQYNAASKVGGSAPGYGPKKK